MFKQKILVFDSIAYRNDSKFANENLLALLDKNANQVYVMTRDDSAWHDCGVKRIHYWEPRWLSRLPHKIPCLMRQLLLMMNILLFMLRHGRIQKLVAASGPGADLCLYFIKALLGVCLIQLVYQPVPVKKHIGRCLMVADHVFYLQSCRHSLLEALAKAGFPRHLSANHFSVMLVGLPHSQWASETTARHPAFYWQASLEEEKGLDMFLEALEHFDDTYRPLSHVSYIRPVDTPQPVSQAPLPIPHVVWREYSSKHAAELRSRSSVFISTSKNEPFGFAILQALAAGLCVVIPRDGAYWDQVLEEGVSCIKYAPGDAYDLHAELEALIEQLDLIEKIGLKGRDVARRYRAETCFRNVVKYLEKPIATEEAITSL